MKQTSYLTKKSLKTFFYMPKMWHQCDNFNEFYPLIFVIKNFHKRLMNHDDVHEKKAAIEKKTKRNKKEEEVK